MNRVDEIINRFNQDELMDQYHKLRDFAIAIRDTNLGATSDHDQVKRAKLIAAKVLKEVK